MQTRVQNNLAVLRRKRGIAASDLAQRVGVSRQTIYAIEAGDYIPNTEVTLRLARELEVSVEELFSLESESRNSPIVMESDVLSTSTLVKGQPVSVCRIGNRWISIPATPYYLPDAEGVVSGARQTTLPVALDEDFASRRLILAGCDPAAKLLARMVEKGTGVEIVPAPASSKLALEWLKQGKAHIAGSHLEDPGSGAFRRKFPKEDFAVITFADWEQGFVAATGNPKGIRRIDQLASTDVQFTNREPGSGSRALLDRLLLEAGVPAKKVRGYNRIAYGHLAAAYSVLAGDADCCVATRSAARAFGLDFVPLHSERYDLVIRRQTLELPAMQAFLDFLQRAELRRRLELLAGYDTSRTGAVLG